MRKKVFYGSPNKIMDFIWSDEISATLYSIANTLFMLEKKIKEGKTIGTVRIDYYSTLSEDEIKRISYLLRVLVLEVLYEDISFVLVKKDLKDKKKSPTFKDCSTICLFSGGVDSTLGIIKSKDYYGEVLGLFVAHQDLGWITKKVEEIRKVLLGERGIELVKFLAPSMGKGYSQLRGFLYVLYGAILSSFVQAGRIIISECGVTMRQPKFAPFDTITYTTHPLVLKISKEISEIILNRTIDIVLPFEDFTKTEMMSLISDDSILSKTHSCITSRWGKNCGKCYACLTRMVGSINLGLSLDYFNENLFEKKDNEILNSLLDFCLNYELNKNEVDYVSLNTIMQYGKEDLFRRFCQETFLSLKKLRDQGDLDINYEFILDYYNEHKPRILEKREEELARIKNPDFNKIL